MVELNKAIEKIKNIICRWYNYDEVLLNLASMIPIEANPNQKTMGINVTGKNPCLHFNPNFVNTISNERLECILVHEYMKVLLKHCTNRLQEPRQISALSSSITITELNNNTPIITGKNPDGSYIKTSIHQLMKDFEDFTPSAKMFNLKENQYFEEYFRNLRDRQQETEDKIKQIWNNMSEQEKKDFIDKAKQNSQNNKGQGEEKQDKNEFEEFDSESEAIKDYFDPNSTSNMGWGENEIFDQTIKNMIDQIKDSSNKWGNITGNFKVQIVAAHTAKISPYSIIKRFAKTTTTERLTSSRLKINRRYDLLNPGHKRIYQSNIILGLDVSGSMSDDDIGEAFAIVNKLFNIAKITCVQFDTEIKNVEKNIKKAKKTFGVYGRGGTDFNKIIEFADNQKADGLIIFTDGQASIPKPPKKCKVLWLMHSKDHNPPNCGFGYVAHLNRYDRINRW